MCNGLKIVGQQVINLIVNAVCCEFRQNQTGIYSTFEINHLKFIWEQGISSDKTQRSHAKDKKQIDLLKIRF